jgi:hypothetical protein
MLSHLYYFFMQCKIMILLQLLELSVDIITLFEMPTVEIL